MASSVVTVFSSAHEVTWLPWAVLYFLLIGLSVGAFLLSLPGIVFRRSAWQATSRRALLGAVLCGVTAPLSLLSDLHQPGRFLNFYLDSNFSSWMAWGAYFIPIYVFGLLLYAWLALRPTLARLAQRGGRWASIYDRLAYGDEEGSTALAAAALLTGLGAVLVLLYSGMEVAVVRARPLWHTPMLPVLFALTAFAGAIGMVHLLDRVLGADTVEATARLNRLLLVTQVLVVVASALWLGLSASDGFWTQLAPHLSWQAAGAYWAAATLLVLWLAYKHDASGWLIGMLAVHNAWLIRWTALIGGQGFSKIGEEFRPYSLPMGYDGLLGLAGIVGLWVALFIVLVTVLPWGNRTEQGAAS